jgi:hypothetical protein
MKAIYHCINITSLLPPGEGQDEGIENQVVGSIWSPHPNPLGNCSMHYSTSCIHAVVPEGEGVYGTAVTPTPLMPINDTDPFIPLFKILNK